MHDARIGAWLGAWQRIEEINRVRQKDPNLPSRVFDVILEEARILTDLACAPEDIGVAAGEHLHQEYIRNKKATEAIERAFANGR